MPEQPAGGNPRQVGPVRDVEGSAHFEFFVVCAVTTIAVTRIYLELTGYPQIGGSGGLHIAHVLFGGLLMLAAVLVFILFLGRRARWVGVFLAGVGFGLFIDEVGKFVTQDNNYFFAPTAAIIYILFVVVYVLVTFLVARRPMSDRELLVNALKMLQEAAADDLDDGEAKEARRLLEKVDPASPLRAPLVAAFDELDAAPTRLGLMARVYQWVRRQVVGATRSPRVERVAVLLFVVFNVLSLAGPVQRALEAADGRSGLGSGDLVYGGSALAVTVASLVALVMWRRGSRLWALRVFALSLTFQLLVVQFFQLLDNTFRGFFWVFVNLLLLGVCRAMLFRREHPDAASAAAPAAYGEREEKGAGSGT